MVLPAGGPDGDAPLSILSVSLQKCVLYWPEKRGIYGRVEVLVSGIRECEHYTTRSLTLKVCVCLRVCVWVCVRAQLRL